MPLNGKTVDPDFAAADKSTLVSDQTNPTIGDRPSEKSVSWAWYSGGWTYAMAGMPDPLFQYLHQPFIDRWDLEPLSGRDACAGDLSSAFEFRSPRPVPGFRACVPPPFDIQRQNAA